MTTPTLIQGDARALPLPDESVDLVVTSPPYFGLRDYGTDTQIGAEPTPAEFLDALLAATAEAVRVLKPSGSLFVNLGDKYAGSGGHAPNAPSTIARRESGGAGSSFRGAGAGEDARQGQAGTRGARWGLPPKSLVMLPERYRIRAVDELGLTARAVIVWDKPNGLPESVTDRVRRSHEDWVHLTKGPRYYSAVDELREHYDGDRALSRRVKHPGTGKHDQRAAWTDSPLGRLPGSVWTIPSQPLNVPAHVGADHYACVDTETEILTRRGWLRHDQLEVGDEVAGYDLDRGLAQWTQCSAVHRYEVDTDLVAVEKRDLSMRLTTNHRTLVVRAGREQIVRADEVRSTDAIPRAAAWEPEQDGREGIGTTMAALCGWIAAEGWYQQTGNVHLSQSASVNPDHVAAIDKLIADAPRPARDAGDRGITRERGNYRARLMHQGRRVTVGAFDSHAEAAAALTAERERLGIDGLRRGEETRTWKGREWVDVVWRLPRGLGDYVRRLMPDKTLTVDLANLPIDEVRVLFEAFVDGDGHRRPQGLGAAGRISIYQKHRTNLDWLQMIAVRLGYRTNLTRDKDRHVLYCNAVRRPLTLRGTNGVNAPIPRERYRGTVWCPTTGTGTMIARRNGRVFITGQSFPMEWPRRLISGWCPREVCTACGEGRRPVTDKTRTNGARGVMSGAAYRPGERTETADGKRHEFATDVTITGYACACPDTTAPATPGVVLDPFGGTGTTALVAHMLGRRGISVDLSADYQRIARWRCSDPKERARAAGLAPEQVAKVPAQQPDQDGLFDIPGVAS